MLHQIRSMSQILLLVKAQQEEGYQNQQFQKVSNLWIGECSPSSTIGQFHGRDTDAAYRDKEQMAARKRLGEWCSLLRCGSGLCLLKNLCDL